MGKQVSEMCPLAKSFLLAPTPLRARWVPRAFRGALGGRDRCSHRIHRGAGKYSALRLGAVRRRRPVVRITSGSCTLSAVNALLLWRRAGALSVCWRVMVRWEVCYLRHNSLTDAVTEPQQPHLSRNSFTLMFGGTLGRIFFGRILEWASSATLVGALWSAFSVCCCVLVRCACHRWSAAFRPFVHARLLCRRQASICMSQVSSLAESTA